MSTPLYHSNVNGLDFVGSLEGIDVWYDPVDAAIPYCLIMGEIHSWVGVYYDGQFKPMWASPEWKDANWKGGLDRAVPLIFAHYQLVHL